MAKKKMKKIIKILLSKAFWFLIGFWTGFGFAIMNLIITAIKKAN